MPLDGIRLHRFRGFSSRTELPLRPLTVLLGPNSAGKSSFGHAIVGLAQAQRHAGGLVADLARPSSHTREAPEWPVDLGSYEDLCSDGESGPVSVELSSEEGWTRLEFGGESGQFGLELSGIEMPKAHEPTTSAPTQIALGPRLQVDVSSTEVLVPGGLTYAVSARPLGSQFTRKLANIWRDERGTDLTLGFRGIEPTSASLAGSQTTQLFDALPLSYLASYLRSVAYLRPCRVSPARAYDRPRAPEGVGPLGQWTAEFLYLRRKQEVILAHPPPVPGVSAGRDLVDTAWRTESVSLSDAIGFWLRYLGIAEKVCSSLIDEGRMVRMDVQLLGAGKARALTDLGFGISQVLPLLVAGSVLGKDDLLVVELPEAQLHPRPQALLADFFCSMIKRGCRLLVETHSEALFHRLRLRAWLDQELEAKIGVYFLERDSSQSNLCSAPREVSLTDDLHWPVGFLADGLDLEISLRAARRARKSIQEGE